MTTDALALGDTLAGKYKILKVLGAGGMGVVYLAENLDIGRQVAIKVLHARIGRDEQAVARFRQEARAAAAIDHPGVVGVFDLGETEAGEPFIVMERLEGQPLSERIRQRGRLSVVEAITILAEALDAIAAAHAAGVIHRDLKPDNLFLVWRPKWGVKILDFGISRIASNEVRLTHSNTIMGTVLYMPPEQARDSRAAGPPADLYALGAVLYHALSGRPPFLGETYSEVLSAVLSDTPVPLSTTALGIPTPLSNLVDGLLAKAPEARPGPAQAVRARLLEMIETVSPPPQPDQVDALLETLPPASAQANAIAATPVRVVDETKADSVAPVVRAEASLVVASPTRRPMVWIATTSLLALGAATYLALRPTEPDPERSSTMREPPPAAVPLDASVAAPDVAVAVAPTDAPDLPDGSLEGADARLGGVRPPVAPSRRVDAGALDAPLLDAEGPRIPVDPKTGMTGLDRGSGTP